MRPVGAPGATLPPNLSSFSPPLDSVKIKAPLHLAEKRRAEAPPEVRAAAEGMEAMFLNYLMKVMRETIPKNEMDLESPATEIYRGLLDTEISERAARQNGIGLAEQIIAYLDSRSYHPNEARPAPRKREAGNGPGDTVASESEEVAKSSNQKTLTVQEVPHVDAGQSDGFSADQSNARR